jgi:prepilin signal peptidase PulO-like enzyme (type II secretory pathway)
MIAANAEGSTRAQRTLALVLWLVSVHSFAVGIGLIFRPAQLMEWVGFAGNQDAFFPVQNGVFHIILAIGYALAAAHPARNRVLVQYTIVVKSLAALFLLLYYAVFDPRWVILVSGIGDGAIAVVVAMCQHVASIGVDGIGSVRLRPTVPESPPSTSTK